MNITKRQLNNIGTRLQRARESLVKAHEEAMEIIQSTEIDLMLLSARKKRRR